MEETPSQLLRRLASYEDPNLLFEALESGFYPFLDALPKKKRTECLSILQDVNSTIEGRGLVGYEIHRTSLASGLKELHADIDRNWHDGYMDQDKITRRVLHEMIEWIPTLWKVGCEMSKELLLVNDCLHLCKSTLTSLGGTRCRNDFSLVDVQEIKIRDSTGALVYYSKGKTFGNALLWTRRELLISTFMAGAPHAEVFQKLLNEVIRYSSLVEEMLKLLKDEVGPVDETPGKCNSFGRAKDQSCPLMNVHWTPDMRSAAIEIKNMLVAHQVADFEKYPNIVQYRFLIDADPSLRERLLAATRAHYFTAKENVNQYEKANLAKCSISIFMAAHADDDLLRVLDENPWLSQFAVGSHTDLMAEAVAHLAGRSASLRPRARMHLETNLLRGQKAVIDKMSDAFPNLQKAFKYLNTEVRAGRLSSQAADKPPSPHPFWGTVNHNTPRSRAPDAVRDPILTKFIHMARWKTWPDDDPGNDERNDYGMARDDLPQKNVMDIEQWGKVLAAWPDVGERDTMREKFRGEVKHGRSFFDVDGVASSLIKRSCSGPGYPRRKQFAQALACLYIYFAPESDEKERVKVEVDRLYSYGYKC